MEHCEWVPDCKPFVYCLSSNRFRHVVGHDTFTLRFVCLAMYRGNLKLKVKVRPAAKPSAQHEGPSVEPFLSTLSRALQPPIPPWRAVLCLK